MITFTAAPAVPASYDRVSSALNPEEILEARRLGYIAESSDPSAEVNNDRAFGHVAAATGDLNDWRCRMFLIWFCYIIDNFSVIREPLGAIEELIFEFGGGPREFDPDDPPLSTLYAGVSEREPITEVERNTEWAFLQKWYERAVQILDDWSAREPEAQGPD